METSAVCLRRSKEMGGERLGMQGNESRTRQAMTEARQGAADSLPHGALARSRAPALHRLLVVAHSHWRLSWPFSGLDCRRARTAGCAAAPRKSKGATAVTPSEAGSTDHAA